MANLVILVKGAQGIELPSVEPKGKAGKITEPGFHPQKLVPGENDVDSAYWDKVKSNPAVKMWLACELLVNKGEGKAKPLIESLDKLSPEVALRHIGRCETISVLNSWKESTDNPAYRKAIGERVQELVASQTGEAEGVPHVAKE